MVLEVSVLEIFHAVTADDARLPQPFGQQTQARGGMGFFQFLGGGKPQPLALDEEPASTQKDQALQRDAPLHGQGQKQQEGELGGIATEAINPSLNAVPNLVDFLREQADHLRPLRVGQVAGAQAQRLTVERPPQAGGGVERDAGADRLRRATGTSRGRTRSQRRSRPTASGT